MACAAKAKNVAVASRIWASRAVVVANLRGNTTKRCNAMRIELSKAGGHLKFLKNSLAQAALAAGGDAGSFTANRAAMSALMNGQVCLFYSDAEDPMAMFKVRVPNKRLHMHTHTHTPLRQKKWCRHACACLARGRLFDYALRSAHP
jgi:ribosomal protein L10